MIYEHEPNLFKEYNMRWLVCFAVTILITCGCMSMPQGKAVPPRLTEIDYPAINEIAECEVGGIMAEYSRVSETEAYEFPNGLNWLWLGTLIQIPSGAIYKASEFKGEVFYCGPGTVVGLLGTATSTFCIRKNADLVEKAEIVGTQPVNIPIGSFREVKLLSEESFRKELIYSGKSDKALHLDYREFNGDLSKPTFSQSMTFDLKEGPIIGFRGARFEIIEATNTLIKFKLLKNL